MSASLSFAQTTTKTKKTSSPVSAKTNSKSNAKKKATPSATTSSRELTIKNLDVTGMRKLEKDAVLNRLVSKAGEFYSEEKIREVAKSAKEIVQKRL